MDHTNRRRLRAATMVTLLAFALPTFANALPASRTQPRRAILPTGHLLVAGITEQAHIRTGSYRDRHAPRLRRATRTAHRAPAAAAGGGASSGGGANWAAVAECESGGNWAANSGNGYWGGLQFSPGTWFANGGGPFDGSGPFPYSAGEQIAVAERVLASQGPGAWPGCFA